VAVDLIRLLFLSHEHYSIIAVNLLTIINITIMVVAFYVVFAVIRNKIE